VPRSSEEKSVLPRRYRKAKVSSMRADRRRRLLSAEVSAKYKNLATQLCERPSSLDAAIAGDTDAVFELHYNNEIGLGAAALAAYWGGTPYDAYRELLSYGWSIDWKLIQRLVGSNTFIRRIFRAGRFEVPFEGKISIYRGTKAFSVRDAAGGTSWSTRRDVACYFAHHAPGCARPIVVTAEIDAADLLYFDDERFEREVIPGQRVTAVADPDPSTWVEASNQYKQSIR